MCSTDWSIWLICSNYVTCRDSWLLVTKYIWCAKGMMNWISIWKQMKIIPCVLHRYHLKASRDAIYMHQDSFIPCKTSEFLYATKKPAPPTLSWSPVATWSIKIGQGRHQLLRKNITNGGITNDVIIYHDVPSAKTSKKTEVGVCFRDLFTSYMFLVIPYNDHFWDGHPIYYPCNCFLCVSFPPANLVKFIHLIQGIEVALFLKAAISEGAKERFF